MSQNKRKVNGNKVKYKKGGLTLMYCKLENGLQIIVVKNYIPNFAVIEKIYKEDDFYNIDLKIGKDIKTYAIEAFGTKLFLNIRHYEWDVKYAFRQEIFSNSYLLLWDYEPCNLKIDEEIELLDLNEIDKKIKYLKMRHIDSVYHFTNVTNIESILKKGLIPRESLRDTDIVYDYNDETRMDNKKDCNCMTLTFPNVRFLNRIANKVMCIIEYGEDLLFRLIKNDRIYFCDYNAARGDKTIGKSFRCLQKMFRNDNIYLKNPAFPMTENLSKPHQRDKDLPPSFPSHDQAEILINAIIRSSNIKRIIFKDEDHIGELKNLLEYNNIEYVVDSSFFTDRKNYIRRKFHG